ncbi:MAG: [Fe-Fe] hydrogenase large subunit C-terminal domain-containing protein [Bacteroidales bacterium]|jgi:PAS domain S-box-containing protein|nr:PAS domain S-box protein [Bacteroidales bacterium]MDD2205297.1 [Fe-Fe] hydrogenase large subunit C-terminal domain-containing protein [Bacteroidales bacterium]MDD3152668.1 [Fe-Fe] hydrogenase large subunit C-terminal domain-containing protein [Bacteroidales bacterium]MDD3914265.1 [Fe-Fe] hydrogenase large subunit C-terminal domain-containing protein [Bacteroidales bacterium]MDD4633420.1 [Fe-Fe] hydrogenase large subunit C-terminal domain-containing protein [Bacteroidales bacterium]
MGDYLVFKKARCKDCYKCLRECPVKAIEIKDHQAQIIADRCILCGRCTIVCPQNAKVVHSERDVVERLLNGDARVIASVAPSCISSFGIQNFYSLKIALGKLGFSDAEETALGANAVVIEYKKLLESGQFKNFITSACPAVCKMIQMYYPKALKYLSPVDSPMVAHAKIIKKENPNAKIVFIGPCIAKKREAFESELIDGVLTFEDLKEMLADRNIDIHDKTYTQIDSQHYFANLAKSFPVTEGIIKSFDYLPKGYEYMAVDGADRCVEVLDNIDSLSGVFLELNTCSHSCINGPCKLELNGGSIKAKSDIRQYVNKEVKELPQQEDNYDFGINITAGYPRIRRNNAPPTEEEITAILAKTGKFKPEDELNCGSCGYATCREKAWAVYNGYADVEMCLPYMRERTESMSYEIIQNSPEGIIVVDNKYNISEINSKALQLLGIHNENVKGKCATDFFNSDVIDMSNVEKSVEKQRIYIEPTNSYIDLSINILKGHNAIFLMMRDVTAKVNYEDKLKGMKMETLKTTDDVIQKQMRVAQEIASLLGETTAETKVALLKLKKTLQKED